MNVARPRRVLLAQTSFLGDIVLTTPLARVVAEALSPCEVWWLVRADAASLIEPLAGRDRVLTFDKRGADRGPAGLISGARRLRALRFDAAIGVQRSFRTAALLALAGIPLRVGFRRTLGAALYHRRVEHAGAHASDRLLRLATGLGIVVPVPPPSPELAVAPAAKEAVDDLLARRGVRSGERILAVAPGSAWATKRWPAARFAEAAKALAGVDVDAVVAVGAPGDTALAAEIGALLAHGSGPRFLDLTGATDLAGLTALLARAHAVIANDSAPAHIAAALGRPVVALFGPTVPAQGFVPLGLRVRIAERTLPCRPCSRHGGDTCPIGTHECLAGLEGEVVATMARELLSGSGRPFGEGGAGEP